jgi:hypothetical protein
MSEQPHVVVDVTGDIVGVFSNEGLAQAHAAKLRLVLPKETYHRPDLLYKVTPLPMDALLGLEVEYYACLIMTPTEVANYTVDNIEIVTETLVRVLPQDYTEQYTVGQGDNEATFVRFDAYGWSREQAIAGIDAMVVAYLAAPHATEVQDA